MTSRRCDRCSGLLFGLIPCPDCHREQLAILALLAILLLVLILFPRSAASDVPVVASAVPAGEFERVSLPFPHPEGLTVDEDFRGHLTDASRSLRVGTQRIAPGSPAPIVTPSPSPSVRAVPSVAPVAALVRPSGQRGASVTGQASWFRSPRGVSAAGPALRTALGPGWRGARVRVTGPAGSAWTVLGDWMAADRLIDLDDDVFPAVCGPLSRGICEAKVTW
jgi:hypothetical protein